MIKKIFSGLLLTVLCCITVCADVSMKSQVSRNKITIGDKTIYTLKIEHDVKDKIVFPELGANLGEFEIKDYRIIGPRTKLVFRKFSIKKKVITEYRYVLEAFITGEFKIPELTIQYTAGDGQSKEIKTGEISVFVEGVKPNKKDTDDIRDIKPPVLVRVSWVVYLVILVFLLSVAGGLGYMYYVQNRKKLDIFAEKEDNRPADVIAYERLEKLKELDLIAKGRIKEYYILLSEIIRKYLEKRYSIPVLERTTGELYRELREHSEIDKKNCTFMKEFLENCDLVKFAKYVPGEEVINRDTGDARKIIDLTRPVQQTIEPQINTGYTQ